MSRNPPQYQNTPGPPAKWPSEHYWKRFWEDPDHPSMPALCEELQVSRKTVYYHLRQHPDYARRMQARSEERRQMVGPR